MSDAFSLAAYDFALPPELIAQFPAERRDASRLMILRDGKIAHSSFDRLPEFLRAGDLLVRNNTRVIPARLYGERASGGKVEILLVRPSDQFPDRVAWRCLAKPLKNLRRGEEIIFADGALRGALGEKVEGQAVFIFDAPTTAEFLATVNRVGALPLPPYIARAEQPLDRERYQTVYARVPGAVAAPTAGLHFTEAVWQELSARGVEVADVTLHVGPGTFKPIAVDDLRQHAMDAEYYDIPVGAAAALDRAWRDGRRIIAVGTTSARTLESAAVAAEKTVPAGGGWTRLFITPGYRWKIVNGLLTNFHLPKSSLLTLVSALCGRECLLAAYAEAVAQRYRFYSYGDATLLWRSEQNVES
ncbi:S-adenosylmethionine:tRNA ribosyltransferase-isomerase [Planctomycetales bacterium]|nr:S-adenosylmethionine:tRNA ribosyltransferase-isomerase [Planctomycetales bacterium]GHT05509.1 S-adenosylmethionine:tRNA ribosyltransferase-isomerase [Planctomycetales bacterium]